MNSTKVCVSDCGAKLFGDLTTHTCQACPTQCVSCTSYNICTDCVAPLFTLKVDKCLCGDPYFKAPADEILNCITCPDGFFGNKSNREC